MLVSLKPLPQSVAHLPTLHPETLLFKMFIFVGRHVVCVCVLSFFSGNQWAPSFGLFEVEPGTFPPGCGDVSSYKTVMNLEIRLFFVFLLRILLWDVSPFCTFNSPSFF